MKNLIVTLIICCIATKAFAQQTEITYITKIQDSSLPDSSLIIPSVTYLQKTNVDADMNRFQILNKNKTLKMSIGGQVTVISMFDFGGVIDNNCFVTSLIPVPTQKGNQFNIYANQSRFNFKVDGLVKEKPLQVFIEADFNGSKGNYFRLRHAYLSYAGFTLGQTWSTFMDLEAAPKTVDGEGPNNEVAVRQPQIRYSYIQKNWTFAIGLEMPINSVQGTMLDGNIEPLGKLKIFEQKKHVPDIPFHVKYKDRFGHIQLAGIFRMLNYGDSLSGKSTTVYVPAGGLSLSGAINLLKNKTKLQYQINGGFGIANYMQDLSGFKYDLAHSTTIGEKMRPTIMCGGFVSLSHNWNKVLTSNIMYGYTSLRSPFKYNQTAQENLALLYKSAQYYAINMFWKFIPFGEVGAEYTWGLRKNLDNQHGVANRINLLCRYSF